MKTTLASHSAFAAPSPNPLPTKRRQLVVADSPHAGWPTETGLVSADCVGGLSAPWALGKSNIIRVFANICSLVPTCRQLVRPMAFPVLFRIL